MIIPRIVERTSRGEEVWDPFSRLLKDRIIMLDSPITDEVASIVIAELLFLESEDPTKDIVMYINCLLYTSPSPRDRTRSRMPSSA